MGKNLLDIDESQQLIQGSLSEQYKATISGYATLILPLPIDQLFTYKIPMHLKINEGDLLIVPFGHAKTQHEEEGHLQIACVHQIYPADQDPCPKVRKKFIISSLPQLPSFHLNHRLFLSQLSKYYHISWGEALKLALPTTRLQRVMLPTAQGKAYYEKILEQQQAQQTAFSIASTEGALIDSQVQQAPLSIVSEGSMIESQAWQKLYQIISIQPIPKAALPYSLSAEMLKHWEETEKLSFIPWPYLGDAWDWLIQSTDQNQTRHYQRKSKAQEIEEYIRQKQSLFLSELKTYPSSILKKTIEGLYLSHKITLTFQYQASQQYLALFKEDYDSSTTQIQLNSEQIHAIDEIQKAKGYQGFLLYGITGSGKTEVYLESIASVLAQGKNALVLVPEIGLTPQTLRRFRKRFTDCIEVWHSQKSPKERFQALSRLKQAQNLILIGTRSALFCPLQNIGIIIIDEAHDPSYKQGEGVRYHARDMALLRGQIEKCPVVLGSATPSLENMYHVQINKLTLLKLTQRPANAILPKVNLIDLKNTHFPVPDAPFLSYPLLNAIQKRLNTSEQSILFLNRRGFSESMRCIRCGFVFKCQSCHIAQTWHQKANELKCHYCLKAIQLPQYCPSCHAHSDYMPIGKGTEKVEDQLKQIFPKANIYRLDRDSEEGFEEFERKMRAQEIDIVVGTQMISKGHDFPNVTLVGILDADKGLELPDFRAAERVYQLLSQVAGRAGRAQKAGEVLIQTYRPEAPFLQTIVQHHFDLFAQQELSIRALIGYPPFSFTVLLRVEHEQLSKINQCLESLNQFLEYKKQSFEFQKRGPMAAPLSMLANRFRFFTFLLFKKREPLHEMLSQLKQEFLPTISISLSIDIDPIDFF